MNETYATIVGNLIDEPTHRQTANGIDLTTFRVMSTARRYDKTAGEWADGDKLYVSVTCWRKLATGVAASLSKGDPVVIKGQLYTKWYETDGQQKMVVQLTADAVGPDLSRCTAGVQRNRSEAAPSMPDWAQPAADRPAPMEVAA